MRMGILAFVFALQTTTSPMVVSTCPAGMYSRGMDATGAPICATPTASAAWGQVTGTLANQTDLQGALDGKEASGSYSGVGACPANQYVRTLNDGAAPTCGQPSGGGGPLIVRKSADQASTSTTFADVAGMTFAVAASTSYSIECNLSYLSAATTTALQVSLNGPASPTAVRFTVWTATSATASHNASQNAYDAVTNPASALTTALPVRLTGTVENGANAGTLALRMRTEVSASSVTIQRGSWCALF